MNKLKNEKIIKLRLRTLGEVELKYISSGDAISFFKILSEKKLSDREFVLKILYNQIIKPRVKFEEFKKLSDKDLIKIARVFIKNETHTFQYFKDTGDFYKDFIVAIKAIKEQQVERIKRIVKSFEPVIKQVVQATQVASRVLETLPLAIIGEQVIVLQNIFQKWIDQHKHIFENITKYLEDVWQNYKIAEDQAIPVLKKYKWFITPGLPINIVFDVMQIEESKDGQEAVDNLFIKYFSANNWQYLEEMVNSWKNNFILKKRLKIIKDCVEILKLDKSSSINEANVILPTLISQIDGALTDYLNSQNIPWDCYYEDYIKNGKVEKVGRKSQFKKHKPVVLTTLFDELVITVFLDTLLQSSQQGQWLEPPIDFIRHRIIKGEIITYGRKDYLIRAFLLLDYIANLKQSIKIGNN